MRKILLQFKAVGNAPILEEKKYEWNIKPVQVESQPFRLVTDFLRKLLWPKGRLNDSSLVRHKEKSISVNAASY